MLVLCILKQIIIRCRDNVFGINATFAKIYNVKHLEKKNQTISRLWKMRRTLGHDIIHRPSMCTCTRTGQALLHIRPLVPAPGRMPLFGERDNNSIIKRCVSCRSLCEHCTNNAVFPSKRIAALPTHTHSPIAHTQAPKYIYIYINNTPHTLTIKVSSIPPPSRCFLFSRTHTFTHKNSSHIYI